MLRKHNTEKWYDLIIIIQNTYKELCTVILIDLKVYIIDTCDIIFNLKKTKINVLI